MFSKFATCGEISELMLEFTGVSVPNAFLTCKYVTPSTESKREEISYGSVMNLLSVQ